MKKNVAFVAPLLVLPIFISCAKTPVDTNPYHVNSTEFKNATTLKGVSYIQMESIETGAHETDYVTVEMSPTVYHIIDVRKYSNKADTYYEEFVAKEESSYTKYHRKDQSATFEVETTTESDFIVPQKSPIVCVGNILKSSGIGYNSFHYYEEDHAYKAAYSPRFLSYIVNDTIKFENKKVLYFEKKDDEQMLNWTDLINTYTYEEKTPELPQQNK